MDAEAIQEIANQLGIAVSAVTKDVIPAYASYDMLLRRMLVELLFLLPLLLLFWSWLDFS